VRSAGKKKGGGKEKTYQTPLRIIKELSGGRGNDRKVEEAERHEVDETEAKGKTVHHVQCRGRRLLVPILFCPTLAERNFPGESTRVERG